MQVFDADGEFLAKWGAIGRINGLFSYPHGITVDSADSIYVADYGNNRTQVFAPRRPP